MLAMHALLYTLLLSIVGAVLPHRAPYNTTSRRVRGAINLHLVPHSHDDVGWLKTVDQYFYGSKNKIQRASVRSILNAVVKELAWNADRRFIVVEQAFFQRWWAEADSRYAALTRAAVAAGQLEFLNGGWCMHDEATPSFADMIDNTAIGHRLLLREFNV
jgi:alpha-mannosidase